MNRTQWIAGLILSVLVILVMFGSAILFRQWNKGQAYIGQREPLPGLNYCSASQLRPCVLSFTLDSDGNMIINILTDRSYSSIFYLRIKHNEGVNIYNCRKATNSSNSVSCIGRALPPGEAMQFQIISTSENIILAGGYFPIIGLAVITPESALMSLSETPLATPPEDDLDILTPTPIEDPGNNGSPPPFPTDDFVAETPTSIGGPPGNSSPPPFATNDSLLTPTSTGGPPGESSPPPGGGPPP